jgi:hypothetical protein
MHAAGPTFRAPERVLINGEQQFAGFAAVLTTANRLPETLKFTGKTESGQCMDRVSRKIDGQTCIRRLLALLQDKGRNPSPMERSSSCEAGNAATRDQNAIRNRDNHQYGLSLCLRAGLGRRSSRGDGSAVRGRRTRIADAGSDGPLLNSSSATQSSVPGYVTGKKHAREGYPLRPLRMLWVGKFALMTASATDRTDCIERHPPQNALVNLPRVTLRGYCKSEGLGCGRNLGLVNRLSIQATR